jgi:hypothetical protein
MMSYEIHLPSESLKQLEAFRAFDSAAIIAEIEQVLMVNPAENP